MSALLYNKFYFVTYPVLICSVKMLCFCRKVNTCRGAPEFLLENGDGTLFVSFVFLMHNSIKCELVLRAYIRY